MPGQVASVAVRSSSPPPPSPWPPPSCDGNLCSAHDEERHKHATQLCRLKTTLIFKGRAYHTGVGLSLQQAVGWFRFDSDIVSRAESPLDAWTRGAHRFQFYAADSAPAWRDHLVAHLPQDCLDVLVHTSHLGREQLAQLHVHLALLSPNVTVVQQNARSQWHRATMALRHALHNGAKLVILTRLDIVPLAAYAPMLWHAQRHAEVVFPFWERTFPWENTDRWLCDSLIVIPRHEGEAFLGVMHTLEAHSADPLVAHREMPGLMEHHNLSFKVWQNETSTCGVGGMTTPTSNSLYRMSGRDSLVTRVDVAMAMLLAFLTFASLVHCFRAHCALRRCFT